MAVRIPARSISRLPTTMHTRNWWQIVWQKQREKGQNFAIGSTKIHTLHQWVGKKKSEKCLFHNFGKQSSVQRKRKTPENRKHLTSTYLWWQQTCFALITHQTLFISDFNMMKLCDFSARFWHHEAPPPLQPISALTTIRHTRLSLWAPYAPRMAINMVAAPTTYSTMRPEVRPSIWRWNRLYSLKFGMFVILECSNCFYSYVFSSMDISEDLRQQSECEDDSTHNLRQRDFRQIQQR